MWNNKTLQQLTTVKAWRPPIPADCSLDDVGVAEAQGWRHTMEDAHVVDLDESVPGVSVVAVFDGHGGARVSTYVARELMPRLAACMKEFGGDPGQALHDALIDVDERMRTDASLQGDSGQLDSMGSTAIAVAFDTTTVTSCWLGDSRAVLCSAGEVIPLSDDHKPEGDAETERIAAAHGYVLRGRVNGALAVSRALGDYQYKANADLTSKEQLVSNFPETRRRRRDHRADEFVIVACDGIWEKVTNDQAAAFVYAAWQSGVHSAAEVGRLLVEWSLLCGSTDNMTCCVAILNEERLGRLSARDVEARLVSVGLSPVALLRAREVFRVRHDDLVQMDEAGVGRALESLGLDRHLDAFAWNRVDGLCLVETTEAEFVDDLHLPPADAKFLTIALQWWEKTTAWNAGY